MHYKDAKTILSANMGGSSGMNVYRGCTHGCIYCDSRSDCYQMQHDFEDVEIKKNAPELLKAALAKKRSRCMIGTGAMCDPYQPIEEQEKITRKCLEIIDEYAFGATLITKSDRVLRDLDILKSINSKTKAVVQMTLTTFDEELCRIIEPAVCTTQRRYETLKILQAEGIPTVVWLSPILPFINDTEDNLRGILNMCFDAGVKGILCFGMGLTLRSGDREYFYEKLDKHFPGMKARYIQKFGLSYECPSPNSSALMKIFRNECRTHSVMCRTNEVFQYLAEFEDKLALDQMSLF